MNEIITTAEVAVLLRINVKTVYKLAEKGLIPGKRIGRSWRFYRRNILELVNRDQRKEEEDASAVSHKKE